jgi:hypothetical protein
MKNKKSPKVLWNVFLFVICGGSLIFGFVQQRKAVENKVEADRYKMQIDSLKMELEKVNSTTLSRDSI